MRTLDCKLERVSNAMVGVVLLFIGSIFTLLGLTVIPVIGVLIAIPVGFMGAIFVLAPRSRACALMTQKVREVTKS